MAIFFTPIGEVLNLTSCANGFCRSKGTKKYTAIDKWNTQLRSLYQTISNRVG